MGGNRNAKNFIIQARADGKRDFYQHDDRGYSGGSNRNDRNNRYRSQGKGGDSSQRDFGGYRQRRRGQGNYRHGGPRPFFQDGDIQMRDDKSRHQQFYERSRGGSRKNRGKGSIMYLPNNSGWNKIVIKQGAAYSKEEVIEAIRSLVDEEFEPVLLEIEAQNVVFFLEKNYSLAKAIGNLSGRLAMGNNHKLYINVMDMIPPVRAITPPQKEIMKLVLSERYGVELKRLDLKKFHGDKTLIREQIFAPLYRPQPLATIMEILSTYCPQVEEMDLSENNLVNMGGFGELLNFTNLKRIYLTKNKLKHMAALHKLKGLPCTEVTLEGNPVCDKFKDGDSYISAVREIFPKVECLDGMDLPKPIGFEVGDDGNLPPVKPSFFFSEEVKSVIVKFLQLYFQVFESDDRKPLEAAYTEDALFSLSSNFPENGVGAKFTSWIDRESRNLKKFTNPERRQTTLHKGRAAVSSVLSRLPKCLHDPNSFVIDIPLAKPCLVHVVLTGVFKQITADKNPPCRNFMKSMIIVPVGSGFCIANEELYINSATVEQIRKAFKTPDPSVAAASSASSSFSPLPNSDVQSPPVELDAAKVELIKQFAINSKMLPEYCRMCLERNNWDFAKAGEMFLNLQKENKIPPEYFGVST